MVHSILAIFMGLLSVVSQAEFANSASSEQGWIHGLRIEGEPPGKGTEIQIVDFKPPSASSLQATVIFIRTESVLKALDNFSRSQIRLPSLSLVIRKNPTSPRPDTEYRMTSVQVLSVKKVENIQGEQLVEATFLFSRVKETEGISLQPGPPPGAPLVTREGPNKGWVYGIEPYGESPRTILDVFEFTCPDGDGELKIVFGGDENLSSILLDLEQGQKIPGELILVLPDKEKLEYVEFKLFNALVAKTSLWTLNAGAEDRIVHEVTLKSNLIKCLTGKD